MAEAGYPAAREYAAEEEHNYSATSFAVHQGNCPGFFCSKVTGAPPFHDVNVTQLIVIDYYYHTVIMLSCTCTLIKKGRTGGWLNNQSVRPVQWRLSGSAPQCTHECASCLAGQHGPEYLHHLPATFLLISSRHAAAEDSTMSWGSTSPRSSC